MYRLTDSAVISIYVTCYLLWSAVYLSLCMHTLPHMCICMWESVFYRFVCLCLSTWHRNGVASNWAPLNRTAMNWTTVTQMHICRTNKPQHTYRHTYVYTPILPAPRTTLQYVATKATTPTSCTGVSFRNGPLCHHLITNTIVFGLLLVYLCVCVWTLVLWPKKISFKHSFTQTS